MSGGGPLKNFSYGRIFHLARVRLPNAKEAAELFSASQERLLEYSISAA
jgi:hypothetical protein